MAGITCHRRRRQLASTGAVKVLFPHPGIPTPNPLPPEHAHIIPPRTSGHYKLDREGEGAFEKLYFVVSPKAVPRLEASLKRFTSRELRNVQDEPLLNRAVNLTERGTPRCLGWAFGEEPASGSRCLTLMGSTDSGESRDGDYSLRARSKPGKGVILQVFSFRHVPPGGSTTTRSPRFTDSD